MIIGELVDSSLLSSHLKKEWVGRFLIASIEVKLLIIDQEVRTVEEKVKLSISSTSEIKLEITYSWV